MSKLRDIFASTAAPLTWRLAFGIALGGALGGAGAYLLNPEAVAMALVTGGLLSITAVVGPLVLALRTVLVTGLLTAAAAAAATAALGITWLSALIMALLAFSASLWTAVPVIGRVASGYPALLFLIVTSYGETVTGGSDWATVGFSAVIGIAAAVVATALLHADDPRGASRRAVAASWDPDATLHEQGLAVQTLQFDGRPRKLSRLLTLAIRACLGRQLAGSGPQGAAESPGVGAGRAADERIRDALLPRGRLIPRVVDLDISALEEEAAQSKGARRFGLHFWHTALGQARGVLAGSEAAPKPRQVTSGLVRQMLWRLLTPDSPTFRFGVQRAVGMGVGMAVLLTFAPGSTFWILLTVFAVLQGDAPTTGAVALVRAAGTIVGVTAGLLLALLLPAEVLYPWLAIAVLLAGFVVVARNYAVMVAASAAAVGWLVGIPDGNVWLWAGLRVLDTAIGALIAFLLTRFLLPVRPDPARRHREALGYLGQLLERLQRAAADPGALGPEVNRFEAQIGSALANYRSEVAALPADQRQAWEADLARLNDQWHQLNALLLLLLSDVGPGSDVVRSAAPGHDDDIAAERDAVVASELARVSEHLAGLSAPDRSR